MNVVVLKDRGHGFTIAATTERYSSWQTMKIHAKKKGNKTLKMEEEEEEDDKEEEKENTEDSTGTEEKEKEDEK
ncbi:hypothetical protein H920_12982 [Fukomys damarensis]|uniref:Uncharacterized protein n=1 Tax=Fukomys damarensis TaxID=885580 RepID=A0A091D573_FUKDA|nr:hypothetical protein H920_12982 [Fukomys damarensis]